MGQVSASYTLPQQSQYQLVVIFGEADNWDAISFLVEVSPAWLSPHCNLTADVPGTIGILRLASSTKGWMDRSEPMDAT
jgi:hypothetical protein